MARLHSRPSAGTIEFCYIPTPPLAQEPKRRRKRRPPGIVAIITIAAVASILVCTLLVGPVKKKASRLIASAFSVQQIVVEGAGDAQIEAVARRCLESLGCTIFSATAERIKRALSSIPTVKDVSVSRRFPSTLIVNITPRVPSFRVWVHGHWEPLSRDGVLLASARIKEPQSLPAIKGLKLQSPADGARVQSDFFPDLVRFVDQIAQSTGLLSSGTIIDCSDPMEVKVVRPGGSCPVLFSLENVTSQIRKYKAAKPVLSQLAKRFSVVDLRFKGQVVLKKR